MYIFNVNRQTFLNLGHTWQKARSTVYQPTTATISSQPQYASHYPPGVYESHVL